MILGINRPFSEEEDKYIRDNYRTMPNDAIAAHLGRSAASIAARKNKLMCENKQRTSRVLYDNYDAIQELVDKGVSYADIAFRFGVSNGCVGYFVRKNGIVKRMKKYKGECPSCQYANERCTMCNHYGMKIYADMLDSNGCRAYKKVM